MDDKAQSEVEADLRIYAAVEAHAESLGPFLRAADLEEIAICYPEMPPVAALKLCISSCDNSYAVVDPSGETLALYGFGTWPTADRPVGSGYVWMVSRDVIFAKNKVRTFRSAKSLFNILDCVYPEGYGNFILSTNSVHLEWVRRHGFEQIGHSMKDGNKFYLMWRSR